MGSFTSIYCDCGDGNGEREVQIKTGCDSCDSYRIGDKVDFWVSTTRAGDCALFDGVYDGVSARRENGKQIFEDWIVVIKDGHVYSAEKYTGSKEDFDAQLEAVREAHNLPKEPPRELWSEELWEEYHRHEEQRKREYEEWLARYCAIRGISKDEMTAEDYMCIYMQHQMKEDSFIRKILPPMDINENNDLEKLS